MKCFQHPALDAVGVCASCGKGVCHDCAVEFQGRMHCKECVKKVAPVPATPSTTSESRRGEVVRLSKGFYLGSIIGGMGVGMVLYIIGIILAIVEMDRWRPNWGPPIFLLLVGLVVLVYGAIMWLRLVYKSWKAVQDGHARTTPGKAVGFLFIPFYNFYWIFQAFWGFAKDCNKYIERHNSPAPKLPEGLFLAFSILSLVGGIPYVGWLAQIPNFVILIIMVIMICDTVNSLPAPSAEAAATPSAQSPSLPSA